MAKFSRDKGNRIEREIVGKLREIGIEAEKVPLSGAAGGSFGGDIVAPKLGTIEVKCRADGSGFVTLERWLGDNDALVLRRDRAEPLMVLPWSTFARLIAKEPTP